MSGPVTVVGIGEDGLDGLGLAARRALEGAGVIYGGPRHLEMLPDTMTAERVPWTKDLDADVVALGAQSAETPVAVLASGDPLFHGIAAKILGTLDSGRVRVIPAPSAFSLAAARMGWSLSDPMVRTVSIHALPLAGLLLHLQPGVKILALSRDGDSPAQVARLLTERGFGESTITVLERMGGDAERCTSAAAADGLDGVFDNLNVLAVDCQGGSDTAALSRAPGLPDDAYQHDGTITKWEVRAVTLAALAPLPGETLWDVGAGNGTVAIEWLRTEPSAHAVAIERNSERLARIRENADRVGVPSLHVVEGAAPDIFDAFDAGPDAIFVGGGIAERPELIEVCLALLAPGGRLVANAVTVPAQTAILGAHAANGGTLTRIGIAREDTVGSVAAMKPALDVLQWKVFKP